MPYGAVGRCGSGAFRGHCYREKFDYTRWQRDYFDGKAPKEISLEAEAFERANPYTGNAVRL